MKRSAVNDAIRFAETFLAAQRFTLPPFARLEPRDWANLGEEAREIADAGLGWDVTDFGLDDFQNRGAVLFTLRNGTLQQLRQGAGKVYCEKVIVMTPGQTVLHHHHRSKTEDIINRAGGRLELILHRAGESGGFSDEEITFSSDGVQQRVPAGATVILNVGESITLEPFVYHQFKALDAPILIGEVSTVNDDANDNFFFEPVGRFSSIEEDQPAHRLLVTEYAEHYRFGTVRHGGY